SLMNIQSVSCVYFSPTGTTKTVLENIARGIECPNIEMIDCTKRSLRKELHFNSELVILGVPVYYGRVPEEVAAYFATFTAHKTPVVPVVVYGNREYEDALKELYDITTKQNFLPVAAAAFIGEHSYSSSLCPIAQGRPDNDDIQKALSFGNQIKKKVNALESLDAMQAILVPGNVPYVEPKYLLLIKQARNSISFTPETDTALCTECGKCAQVCPIEAISLDDLTKTDKWQCIICFACIKNCPSGARQMKDQNFGIQIRKLQKICQRRKEPELYI
ncbi:MAG TPA: EFR1 family ferrodoxin, partial [Desulfobacteraceae bacterium]|nr:EFR1 family ferrodoxin [Desulfobacteraceae bacterium]